MLLKTLKAAARAILSGRSGAASGASAGSVSGSGPDSVSEYPLEIERKLNEAHGRAPVNRHLDILFQNARIGGQSFVETYWRCLQRTGTGVTPFNLFQRFQTRLELIHYFLATLALPGARAECGAYRGATALLLAEVWRNRQPAFRGRDLYLIDSFSGTSPSVGQDLIPVRGADSAPRMEPFFPAGKFDTSLDEVRGHFREFPEVTFCAGWIPQVFGSLPERDWAFVHLDLTLYEPTLASLEYFYPRLNPGGVMICDGSIFCPGAEKAWEEFCTRHGVPYVMLGHREFVILKDAA
jgi:hypothetical protein